VNNPGKLNQKYTHILTKIQVTWRDQGSTLDISHTSDKSKQLRDVKNVECRALTPF